MTKRSDLASKCLEALTTPSKGRVKVVRKALESGVLEDPSFVTPLVGALSDRSGVFADTMADAILPEIGESLLDPLLEGFDELNEPVRFRHLRVIQKLASETALECARRSARAKHAKLSVECLEILAGSTEDASLLIELAGSRSRDRSFQAYRSLAGIRTVEVREFLRERLVDGEGFPNFAVAYQPDASHAETILELLMARLPALEAGEQPSESEARHFIVLLKSAAGQGFQGFDDALARCLEIAATKKEVLNSYSSFVLDFAEFTLEAISSNPVEEAQRLLVKRREEFGVEHQFFAFNAAAQLDDVPLFETFAPSLADQNPRARCRGWDCSARMGYWPCSIVSALEYLRDLDRGLDPHGQPLAEQAALVQKIKDEPRWAGALKKLGEPH